MSKRDPILLGAALEKLAFAPPPGVWRPPLSPRQWEQAVGTRIAANSQPVRLERGVLHVRVAHSVWASELSLLSGEICAELARAGFAVDSLRFSVGRLERSIARPPEPAEAPRPAALPPELERAAGEIADEALRQALTRAAAVSLGASKRPKNRRGR